MNIHEFNTELWLPRPREVLFQFFSNAANLDRITPRWLHFEIVTPQPLEIRQGSLIDYRLRVRGFALRWRTRINEWQPPRRFVDEQIRGPYRRWIHEHTFESERGGTLIRDRLSYAVPFDFLLHRVFVRPDIEKIFRFRSESLRAIFSEGPANSEEAQRNC